MRRYQRLVGQFNLSLPYLVVVSAVRVVSQFMQDPRSTHLEVVYQILRDLKFVPWKGFYGHM